ncbi:MAG: hypothetical protein ACTSWY_13545 [Promethearchaeota archaeon]
MRRGGCSQRDVGLQERYPDNSMEEIMKFYFSLKKELANILLKGAKNQKLVEDFLK